MKAPLAELGVTAAQRLACGLQRLIADETKKWAEVIRFAGIRAE